jgi:hypothetical protein
MEVGAYNENGSPRTSWFLLGSFQTYPFADAAVHATWAYPVANDFQALA